jgi:hypothetical protein
MSQARRLAAILAADIVGYSQLMGLDETGTAQALREHRAAADPLIGRHGGRVVIPAWPKTQHHVRAKPREISYLQPLSERLEGLRRASLSLPLAPAKAR